MFDKLFNKQNRPRKFRNSFSAHSVNSTQRIAQYCKDEEDYDNEKNESLCKRNEDLDETWPDGVNEEFSDELEEVKSDVLEDILNSEVLKEILNEIHDEKMNRCKTNEQRRNRETEDTDLQSRYYEDGPTFHRNPIYRGSDMLLNSKNTQKAQFCPFCEKCQELKEMNEGKKVEDSTAVGQSSAPESCT